MAIVRELLTRIGYVVDPKAEKKAKDGFQRVKDAAGKLGIALSAGLVAAGFKRTLDAASDVEETMNVVTTAFEDQTEAVLQWARDSGEAAGRSEFAMREYAATLGAVVGPTLGSAEATAELSTNMAQLAVDLGSFFNATDEDALQALRSGLVGQAEPLLRFGVAMNVAALDAFALEQGLGKTTKQMSQAEKITLRYRFILDQTQKAQGDAEKTSAGFANQTKRLVGNVRDIAVAIGKQFLPGAADLLVTLNGILKTIKGPLVAALRLLTAPIKVAVTTVAGLAVGLTQMGRVAQVVFAGLLGAVLALKAPFIITGAIIAAIIFGTLLIIEDLWKGLTEGEGVLAGLTGEFQHWEKETGSTFDAVGKIFENAVDFWIQELTGVEGATEGTLNEIFMSAQALGKSTTEFFGEQADLIFGFWDDVFTRIGKVVSEFISEWLEPLFDKVRPFIDRIGGFGSAVGRLATGGDFFGGGITPPGAARGGDVNSNQTVDININAPNGDAQAIGKATGDAVRNAGAEMFRRTQQQLAVGGSTP